MKTKKIKPQEVSDILTAAAETFAQRNKVYGSNYKKFGKLMIGLFPDGFAPKTEQDWVKLGLLLNIVTNLGRYSSSMTRVGLGHGDSARDISVFAAMLEEVSHER